MQRCRNLSSSSSLASLKHCACRWASMQGASRSRCVFLWLTPVSLTKISMVRRTGPLGEAPNSKHVPVKALDRTARSS